MSEAQQQALFDRVSDALRRTEDDTRPIVLMTCGLAGSGKSTLAKAVTARLPNFTRLSVDEIIHSKHGVYGVDYPADMALYQAYMDEAGQIFDDLFATYLRDERRDLVLDRSFYAKEDRDDFRARVEALVGGSGGGGGGGGARVVLVFFRPTDKEVSWRRIVERKKESKTANNALEIDRQLFEMYWAGFEDPVGEGEIVIDVV
ncbi:P-loop containing nucleoside triphosphate hydrolase protein [Microdochium trichocladiopsis]|uniref:P-loop containing nucleoside triphosphate hydrolase protein n=1 Tax=Microdochium trichocladiopsis TaxID=1682393 RepID=A0A9P9BIZ5_9PEZI|nr:P-loop containing nucleoside triphosphate hydrolase protein [Microdochium trichocladiopsis]KAH7014116.1 P-loop containing nucleoside triphosphate hydrolase protein [Microdochium trichocladiopsis]